ncbi:hypothetical protein Dform_01669 [Dehalogenimonas formicexedens]|uniref:Uncharacterized protein n=1 Tax=Dehalogenimonas formicexedens TaxID=1839801 RepID=A0A1P8F971_9CHLR|nr:hypothetical protein Dform_01669 [Dehalogenimonas formicexedens]
MIILVIVVIGLIVWLVANNNGWRMGLGSEFQARPDGDRQGALRQGRDHQRSIRGDQEGPDRPTISWSKRKGEASSLPFYLF